MYSNSMYMLLLKLDTQRERDRRTDGRTDRETHRQRERGRERECSPGSEAFRLGNVG